MKPPVRNNIRVAVAQYWVRPIKVWEEFADQVTAAFETARGYKCRLLVLPEYFTIQLMSLDDPHRPITEKVRQVATYVPRFVELMQSLARKHELYVVAGTIPVIDEGDDRVYNDAFVFAPTGDYDFQGKLHMTRWERTEWIVSERNQLKIFEADFGRFSVPICYDVEFPEIIRAVAQQGVHILTVPSNTDDRLGFLRVRYCAHARCIENQLYALHSPTVGTLPRVPDASLNYGQASILTPCDFPFARDGILAEGVLNQETIVIGELDMDAIERSRTFGTVLPLTDSKHSYEIARNIHTVTL
jgi:predicted amidohydrolase